jgi:hypothetical protein
MNRGPAVARVRRAGGGCGADGRASVVKVL